MGDNMKCSECDMEMIDNCKLEGQHPFELGVDGRSDISLHVPTGETKVNFLGMEYEGMNSFNLKARVCPKCRKVEFYIVPKEK